MKNRSTNSFLDNCISFSNEEALDIFLNNLDEVIIMIDRDFRITHATKKTRNDVLKNFGIEINPETTLFEIAALNDRPYIVEIGNNVFNGKERELITEMEIDGTIAIFHTYFSPAYNSAGEIVGAIVRSKDITRQKRAEEGLKETEERWRFALEGGNQGVWDWNVQSGEIFFSDSYKKLYGYGPDDLKGRIEEWENIIHPDDKAQLNKAIEEHLSSTNPYQESIYRVKTKVGSYKWILGRGMLIRDSEGKPSRMIGTHTDITNQITVEQTYKLLFYSNPLPMWTYNLDTLRIVTVNDAAINHYGYSKEEFLSMTIKDIRPRENLATLMEWVSERKQSGRLLRTTNHLKKNGEVITVDLTTHKLEDKDTVLVVAQDITSKIKAEEDLRKSNERFRLASQATSDAIYDYNLETTEVDWGEGLYNLFGFNSKEVSISVWEELIHPFDRKRVKNSIRSALKNASKKFWKEEYRFAKKDGSYSHVFDRAFIIRNGDQKVIRMIGSLQDITERKYAEQVLSLERSVFELSNQPGIDFKWLAQLALTGLEEIHDDAYTSLFLLKDDNSFETFVAPRLPEGYCEMINGLKIGPDDGSCGAAIARKETVIAEDISSDPLWRKYRATALQFDLRSCWSLPIILTSGKVIGTFAIYHKKIKSPSIVELNTIERVRNILRVLLEHHWSLDEIKKANERFDIIMKATHDLVWEWELATGRLFHDKLGLQKVYGICDNKSVQTIEQWLTHIHADDLQRVQKVVDNILLTKDENTFDLEYRFRGADGIYRHVYDRGVVLKNEDDKPVRVMGAAQNITERKNLEEELLRNELDKQKAINQATVDSQERERTEIGKELHDNVNQILTTTKLYLDLASSNDGLKDELIKKSSSNIIAVINEIRQLSRSLMDPTIGDLGLIDSINDLIESINLTRKLHVSLEADRKLELVLSKNHQLTIFRILQEALNNAMKHAKATSVKISFKFRSNNAELSITDDGIGFEPFAVKMGAGMKNIQNRVYLINGTHRIISAPDQGCKIIINFPIVK